MQLSFQPRIISPIAYTW